MARHIFTLILAIVTLFGYGESYAYDRGDLEEANRVVEKIQRVPAHTFFCSDDRWESDSESTTKELRAYLSVELLRLFLWIQCGEPKQPIPLSSEKNYNWDFRYGLSRGDSNSSKSSAKNLRIQKARFLPNNRATVKATYNIYLAGNTDLITTYTLIQEGHAWKIDDVSLKGYVTSYDEVLPSRKSLKTELQMAYKRAEARNK